MATVFCKRCNKRIARVSDVRNCSRCGNNAAIPATASDHDWLTSSIISSMDTGNFVSAPSESYSGGGGLSGGAGAGGSWDSGSSSSDSSSSYDSGSSSSDSGGSSGGSD